MIIVIYFSKREERGSSHWKYVNKFHRTLQYDSLHLVSLIIFCGDLIHPALLGVTVLAVVVSTDERGEVWYWLVCTDDVTGGLLCAPEIFSPCLRFFNLKCHNIYYLTSEFSYLTMQITIILNIHSFIPKLQYSFVIPKIVGSINISINTSSLSGHNCEILYDSCS